MGRAVGIAAAGTVAATFVLLVAGGLVTSLEVGLSVPDWPRTFDEGMLTTAMRDLPRDAQVEHTHRLLGAAVGCCTLLLAACALVSDARRPVRAWAAVAVGAVIAQGVLGGLRVTERSVAWAMVHAALAQAFFALVVGLATVTAATWATAARRPGDPAGPAPAGACAAAAGLCYAQTLLGVLTRHTGAFGIAHAHLLGALVTLGAVALAASRATGYAALRGPAAAALGILVCQLGLGLGAWALAFPAGVAGGTAPAAVAVATAHVAGGAALLGCLVVLALRARAVGATAVGIDEPLEYSKVSPGLSTGCSPTTPMPRTSCTWLSASVMIQCRLTSCAEVLPLLVMRMV